ncbi:MAG: DUF3050 domain-containing protein [Deltaproteobacteria bacterium]|jgi:hypothetical protein|nr:DUF3050 domain-containing protein [Deltaproteobacteria bacterium]MBT6432903.1 DUF3050 domain-containing protein [Deltaproteobacteria bacterium]MBT6492103.1 DUF3050 domain-containing protein [Deltaproteobacteria bacterium]
MSTNPSQPIIEQLKLNGGAGSEAVLTRLRKLYTHPMGSQMNCIDDVRIFMEHHVWAVWDFMSLLGSCQAALTPSRFPWQPIEDPEGGRIITEIGLEELTDQHPDGHYVSHFELYLEAMEKAGANQKPILHFLEELKTGKPWPKALDNLQVKRRSIFSGTKQKLTAPLEAIEFTRSTLEICESPLNRRVAAFTLGRETVLPTLFQKALNLIATVPTATGMQERADLSMLKYYLDRHIELDGDTHGPMCARLFTRYCMKDAATKSDSFYTLCEVIDQRIALWDAVEKRMNESKEKHLAIVEELPERQATLTKLTSSQGE